MSGADGTHEWWTTDHRLIREWARARGAEPVLVEQAGEDTLQFQADPADKPGERIPWSAFFERFEEQGQALLQRNPGAAEGSGSGVDWQVIDRDGVPDHVEAATKTEQPANVDSDQLALSDTGEAEPVTFDRTEAAPDGPDDEQVSTAGTKDRAIGSPSTDSLTLDTIREQTVGPDDWHVADESVTVRNEGETPLDLGGWTVRNEAGQSYRIPDDVTLDPGGRLTVHSEDGRDTETDLYWDADEPVWPNRGGTVAVETPGGERVVEASYKGGR